MFVNNWNLLAISPNWFINDVDTAINEVFEIAQSDNLDIIDERLVPAAADSEYDEEEIRNWMYTIARDYPESYQDINTSVGMAYYQLQQALLATQGYHIYEEPDFGTWVNGIWPNGTYITNLGQSKSANLRTIKLLQDRFRERYSNLFTEISAEFTKKVDRVFKA